MTTCKLDGCEFDHHNSFDECILHCEKGSEEISDLDFLHRFRQQLILHITDQIQEIQKPRPEQRAKLDAYLGGSNTNLTSDITNLAKESITVLSKVRFPNSPTRATSQLERILNLLGSIHFDTCEFNVTVLHIPKPAQFYQDCLFKRQWYVKDCPVLADPNVLYQSCTFFEDVSCGINHDEEPMIISCSLFADCSFKKSLELYNTHFKEPVFCNEEIPGAKKPVYRIREISISSCVFLKNFVLNYRQFDSFRCNDSIFKENFEFKHNNANIYEIVNSTFEQLSDCYKTRFQEFKIERSIIEHFAGFESCHFGKKNNSRLKYQTKFTYATFLSFVIFRNTQFYSGLDLENINFRQPVNFLNTVISPQNTTRETFRIIKNSFDAVGNYIDANKFFAFELKQYRIELKRNGTFSEKLIYFLNDKISGFGQSYFRPIFWMFVAGGLNAFIISLYEENYLYQIYRPANNLISFISSYANKFADAFPLVSRFLTEGMEFVSLLFYIVFSVLLWQLIVAIKRHTKR